ncbi:MAG: hypothetical protein NTX53_07115 [candidate division WOR-3 bacterium]|nr:hypothetical protein [candidate division WOR-3 bacterium]
MRHRVLWIEDELTTTLSIMAAPIYTSGRYHLTVAVDATEGVRCLLSEEYSVVIVDIRLPPGTDQQWSDLWNAYGASKSPARLGLRLLEALFDPAAAALKLESRPAWVVPARFGVLTVEGESEVADRLAQLGIRCYVQKKAGLPYTAVVDMIERILDNSSSRKTP